MAGVHIKTSIQKKKKKKSPHTKGTVHIETLPHENTPSRPQWIRVSPIFTEQRKLSEEAEKLFPIKTAGEEPLKDKTDQSILDNEIKMEIIKMLTELRLSI